MRGLSAWGAAFVLTAVVACAVPAAPVNPASSAPPQSAANPGLRAESLSYAYALQSVFANIEEQYVRPVARADLAEAALDGLFEAVRESLPPDLKRELRRTEGRDPIQLLAAAREGLGTHDALKGSRALVASLRALPRALDPYCGLTTPRGALFEYEGVMTGSGLEFASPLPTIRGLAPDGEFLNNELVLRAERPPSASGPARILNVLPGSPAQRAGLRPGDLIVKLDGHPPEHPAFAVLYQRLRPVPMGGEFNPGRPPAPCRLTVLRAGDSEPREFAVTQESYRTETVFGAARRPDGTWDYLLDPVEKVGYARIGTIGNRSHEELHAALRSLRAASARGLILDLRWNPGGYLQPAATIAHLLLLPDCPIASTRERGKVSNVEFLPTGGTYADLPVVVLINGDTTGGGELIAAALQDHGRAIVAGQRTVGKASVQRELERINIPFKISTGTFVRPSGKNLQRFSDSKLSDDWGIRPDAGREVALTPELSRQLKEWYTLHALRPAGGRDALPLDDPEADPQRQAARSMLRELMAKE